MSDIEQIDFNKTSILDDPRLDMLRDASGNLALTEQQATAVLERGKLLISAAAGSGKTSTLVKRILLMVSEGAFGLRDMLVCVYNDSAQAELKQRLHSGLINVAIGENDPVRRNRLLKAIDDLPFCHISTIHAFCASLIRENFEKLGISPMFEIADDAKISSLMNKAMDEAFDACDVRGDEVFATLVDVLAEGRNEDGLRKYVVKMYERMILHEDREEFSRKVCSDFDNSPLHAALLDLYMRQFCDALPWLQELRDRVCNCEFLIRKKNLAAPMAQTVEIVEKMLKASSFEELCSVAKQAPPLAEYGDARGKFPDDATKELLVIARSCIEEVFGAVNLLSGIKDNWQKYREYHKQNVLFISKLLELTEMTEAALERMKSEQNLLGYQDLLTLAARLLKEDPDLADEFKVIFVDEYQDVDPLQESIFEKLIKDECFMVGDVKQSIYGFRLADPTILMSRKAAFEAGAGKVVDFNANFRSDPDILRFVNEVFNTAMTLNSADVDYAHDGAFSISRRNESEGPASEAVPPRTGENRSAVRLCFFQNKDNPKQKKRAASGIYDITAPIDEEQGESLIDRQAKFILSEIRSIVGHMMDSGSPNGRLLDYGDIAILSALTVPKSKLLQKVLKTLTDAGIPVDATNAGDEAVGAGKDLILMLKALDNPRQDVPFAGYLLSYFGGYNEQELADISAFKGDCFYDKFLAASKGDGAFAQKIRGTLATLDEYRLKASFKNVRELMQSIVSDSMYDAYLMGRGGGDLVGLKNFIAATDEVSLGRFLEDYSSVDSKIVGANTNSVKVSTIHRFKGLESPVVFVLDISRPISEPSEQLIISSRGAVGMTYYDLDSRVFRDTFSHIALKKIEKANDIKATMRLMYVAFTRAKQLMYIMESVPKKFAFAQAPILSISNARDILSLAKFKRSLRWEPDYIDEVIDPDAEPHSPVMNFTPDERLQEDVTIARQQSYAHSEATQMAMKYSVSQLGDFDEQTQSLFDEKDKTQAKMGTAYHKVMQNIDFSCATQEDVCAELDRMTAQKLLAQDERDMIKDEDILKCLQSPIMRFALEADVNGECEREKPFMMLKSAKQLGIGQSEDKVLVQGVIDLLIKGEQLVILDFKTGYITQDNVPERYKRQLYLYKMAVEAAIGEKVDKVLLYSFKSGETVDVT